MTHEHNAQPLTVAASDAPMANGIDDIAAVSPATLAQAWDCSERHIWHLIDRGELQTFLSGRRRKITLSSARAYRNRQIAAASAAA
jgi:hypothetical protein